MAEVKSVPQPGNYVVSTRMKTVYSVLIFLGLAAFVVAIINDQARAWHAYLIGLFYFVSLALGGLFFTAIQHVTKAGWSVTVRRISEAFTSFIPVGAVAALILVFFGGNHLYEWFHADVVAKDHLLSHKAGYLNPTFFAVRVVLFFGIWWLLAKVLVGNSVKQDTTGDESITHKLVGVSVGAVLVFAFSYSFFSVDTLMSLDAHWFSTIFGVYAFAGLFQSTMAVMILVILYLKGKGLLHGLVNENHVHDLGKFLFAFTVFWAYIAFSQYMLIWYANMPEETIFYVPRSQGSWAMVSVALILFKFIVPFFALLPRWAKRTPSYLAVASVWILVMQFVDIYWLVYPSYNEEHAVFSVYEVLIFAGFLGAFLLTLTRFLSRNNLVPVKDPRIQEALHHHVVYH
ncbi:MAG: molybdopterin oxidoreductase [Pseudobdellovibrionaceae bacterium]|nr:molybdopterin oxidoreductase [Bdellovibrionales bacterium]USN47731.1 MAG: molybdopterin oxidoreductase [Pseudobdellovibrionaceae bacterium]